MKTNYFEDKLFLNDEYHYPQILWPSLLLVVFNEEKKFKDPQKPNPPTPPGCLSSIFGQDRNYKIVYNEYLNDLKLYNELVKINELKKEELYKRLRKPYNYIEEFDNLVDGIFSITKDIEGDTITKKGFIEETFLELLNHYFPEEIYINKTLKAVKNIRHQYAPDFIFAHKKSKLRIDIEIDEPYTLESREPIHYIYVEEISCFTDIKKIDKNRDLYFTHNGWFILKFSEEQVLHQPHECCHLIADMIEITTKDSSYKKMFTGINYPKPHKVWSIKHCIDLERIMYRESYLNISKFRQHTELKEIHKKRISMINKFIEYNKNYDDLKRVKAMLDKLN